MQVQVMGSTAYAARARRPCISCAAQRWLPSGRARRAIPTYYYYYAAGAPAVAPGRANGRWRTGLLPGAGRGRVVRACSASDDVAVHRPNRCYCACSCGPTVQASSMAGRAKLLYFPHREDEHGPRGKSEYAETTIIYTTQ